MTYTILSILTFNVAQTDGEDSKDVFCRTYIAYTIIGGACDLFLTIMIWFVFDEVKSLNIFEDGHRSYPVLEVVKVTNNSILCEDSFVSEIEED